MRDKLLWSVFLVVALLDQLTKNLVLGQFREGELLPIIPGIFNLTLVYNKGVAFGLFSNFPDQYRHLSIAAVSMVALGVVFLMMREAEGDRISQVSLAGILAGALGNLLDRFRFDAVVDFLDFYIGQNHWPAFNVADSAICIGVGALIWRMTFPLKVQETTE